MRGRRGSRRWRAQRRSRRPTRRPASPRRRRAPSTRSSCTSVARCTSSTATPAASGGGSPRAVRKQRSGRSRFPPAASASFDDLGREPRPRRDRACEPRLDLGHVRREAGRRGDACERVHAPPRTAVPMWSATIVPPRRRNRTSAKPASPHQRGKVLGRREALHRGGQVGVRVAARQHLAEQRDEAVEPEREERAQRAARLRDLEDRDPPARAQHAPELARARARGRRRCARRSRPSPRRSSRRRTAARAGRPAPSRPAAPCGAPARACARREVEARHARRARAQAGEGEVAGAARGVEHAVAGPDDRLGAPSRRQRRSRPIVITRFITS